jgi:sugar phosphate isomerase/epimerase
MQTSRRSFLAAAALGMAGFGLRAASFVKGKSPMKLGTVTYNLAHTWDIATIIKRCGAAKFEGVELRATHAHKVELNLTKGERADVKKRFADSPVDLMGMGSVYDYHTPDPTKLRRDIEATKRYLQLAHDVGAEGIKVRPNGLPKGVPVEKTLAQIGKSLRELGETARDLKQQIRVEVHGRGTSLLPHMKTIMDAANHPSVGVCWNCNPTDLVGKGFDHNLDLVKTKINVVHLRDLHLETYPFRRLFKRLGEVKFTGYCLAEIPESKEPERLMRYYRSLWLAYQDLL